MGHYCWKCGQYLANEILGQGHARHICKCMAEERAHRRQILKEKRERGEIPELKLKPVSQEVIDYVENEIIPAMPPLTRRIRRAMSEWSLNRA